MGQLSHTMWRKSSYSTGSGGDCVEVAAVWRKSSRNTGTGGDCVEVAHHRPGLVAVRDSKDRGGPQLSISDQAWSRFVQGIKDRSGPELAFSNQTWSEFIQGIKGGQFDLT
jgi:Domain of unknown function (DUF397)